MTRINKSMAQLARSIGNEKAAQDLDDVDVNREAMTDFNAVR